MDMLIFYEFSNYDIFDIEQEKLLKGHIEPDKVFVGDLKFESPLDFTINITRKGYKFFFVVNVNTTLCLLCDRCLENYNFKLQSNMEFLFEYNKVETEYITGHILNVKDLILAEIYLNLPLKKLCNHKCKGLCAHCGVNLNNEQCSCAEDNLILNPFAKIGSLIN